MQHPTPDDAPRSAVKSHFPALKQGQKLAGCYVLQSPKHVSDTSAVWLARDEVLDKDVALHFIPQPVRGDEKAMDELRALTKRNRQLIHPSILRIYDFVEESDWAAISTDAIEGECLADVRASRPHQMFEVADLKPWLGQVCQTLDDAHKIQLVHADLSPEHVFLDRAGRVTVANFGIGRCVRDALWRASGGNAGTPPVENLSPQTLDGNAPTAADDVYATGILLHELLAGEAPFSGADAGEKIRTAPAPRIVERRSQVKKAGGPISPIWEKAIATCLEKNPDQRPKTLADLASKLGLSKTAGAAEEPIAPVAAPVAVPAAPPAPEPTAEETPIIPVVKRAWAGPASAPVFGGATVSAAERALRQELDAEAEAEQALAAAPDSPETRNALEDHPSLGGRRSGFPVTGVAAATILGGLCAYAVFFGGFRRNDPVENPPIAQSESTVEPQYEPVKNPITPKTDVVPSPVTDPLPTAEVAPEAVAEAPKTESAPAVPAAPVIAAASTAQTPATPVTVAASIPEPAPVVPAKPEFDQELILAANPKPKKNPTAATPIPAAPAADSSSSNSVAAKTAALEAARKAADEWDRAHATMLQKKSQAEAAIAEAKKAFDEKAKAVAPILKASEEVAALKQKRESELRAAELAAAEAKKAAEEKLRLAEEAKAAVANVEKENKDKLTGQKKAESELDEIKKAIAENERLAAESAKLADGAMAKKAEQLTLVKQKEQEVALAMAAAEIEAQKKRELEEKRNRIMKEMDEAKRLFEERMKALESSLKNPDSSPAPAAPAAPPAPAAPEKAPAETKPAAPTAPATPPPAAAVPPTPPTTAPATAGAAAPAPTTTTTPEPPKAPASTAPVLPPENSTLLAKMEKPTAPTVADTKPTPPAPPATTVPATNSLGIGFVPVGDVQFAIWPTRLKDFEAFAAATGLKSTLWRDPGFKQGPDHPVVNVTWMEAMAFCKWLTFKEQREGTLPPGKAYRLPTDLEWSRAVGLPEESGKTAEARDMGVPDVYPWGTAWPPPQGAGNYTGEETGSDVAIKGYSDGFPWTSPVGSFPANKYGLYDMGGNVWQWVMDQWNTDPTSKVLRGASWYNGALKLSLLSSCRVHAAQDSSTDNYGFRCVIANEGPKAPKR